MKRARIFKKMIMPALLALVVCGSYSAWAQKADAIAPVVSESSPKPDLTGIETQLINSMKNESEFPEKAEFIADEDKADSQKAAAQEALKAQSQDSLGNLPGAPVQVPMNEGVDTTRMLSSTAMVVGLIVILAAAWRFLQGRSSRFLPSQDRLKIVAQQLVNPRSKIMIVEALGKNYLVGATADRIQLLADLDFFDSAEGGVVAEDFTEAASISTISPKAQTAMEFEVPTSPAAEKLREKLKNLKKISSGR